MLLVWSCQSNQSDVASYHHYTNLAELAICVEQFSEAVDFYRTAFDKIELPFGHDLYNAALACQLSSRKLERNEYLKDLVDHSQEYEKIQETFRGIYLSEDEWQDLIDHRSISYNEILREEMLELNDIDQMFRPLYDTYTDTIEVNRLRNMDKIAAIEDRLGYPSHYELGYSSLLRGQPQDIVLHHTAQRRSGDKSVVDLYPLLSRAVQTGRMDPEQAVFYLKMQNDEDKRDFVTYSSWQYRHPTLPDSLSQKLWYDQLKEEQFRSANAVLQEWNADRLEDIVIKANFLSTSDQPFIFTSVRKSIVNLSDQIDSAEVLMQYLLFTQYKEERIISSDP